MILGMFFVNEVTFALFIEMRFECAALSPLRQPYKSSQVEVLRFTSSSRLLDTPSNLPHKKLELLESSQTLNLSATLQPRAGF